MVQCADHIGKPMQLLYYPPYHSKYNQRSDKKLRTIQVPTFQFSQ